MVGERDYRIMHRDGLLWEEAREVRTCEMASLNTAFRFSLVSALHSMYLTHLGNSLAKASAAAVVTGFWCFAARACIVFSSERKSDLVPTRMKGTLGAW